VHERGARKRDRLLVICLAGVHNNGDTQSVSSQLMSAGTPSHSKCWSCRHLVAVENHVTFET